MGLEVAQKVSPESFFNCRKKGIRRKNTAKCWKMLISCYVHANVHGNIFELPLKRHIAPLYLLPHAKRKTQQWEKKPKKKEKNSEILCLQRITSNIEKEFSSKVKFLFWGQTSVRIFLWGPRENDGWQWVGKLYSFRTFLSKLREKLSLSLREISLNREHLSTISRKTFHPMCHINPS